MKNIAFIGVGGYFGGKMAQLLNAYEFPYDTKTSFQRDFEIPTKLDERALFGKSLIKLSKKHNICIPNIKMTYERINTLMNKSFLV